MKSVFVSHGGGPLPILRAPSHGELPDSLARLGKVIREATPRAILVVSAHWEEDHVTVNSAQRPFLLFDYHGFPSETYEYKYDAEGNAAVAKKVAGALRSAGVEACMTEDRGWDHGVFVPFMMMLPDAAIPLIQVSLHTSLDPAQHLAIGRALAGLSADGIMLVGSGMSYHNMRGLGGNSGQAHSRLFHEWIIAALASPASERERLLEHWELAPGARECHPREEHLLPLHVCVGAAGEASAKVEVMEVMGVDCCCVVFG